MGVTIPEQHHWCPKQEKLLIGWAEKAAGYRWLHNYSRMFYKKQNDWLSYPCIIISSITGVGGFAVLSPNDESMTDEKKKQIIAVQYFFAFLNVLAGILTSVSKFNNSSKMMETHSSMCIQWSKFYRNIEMELSLETEHRGDVNEFVTKCRQEYDRLLDDSPDIPPNAIDAFNMAFPDKENKPDVCNGLNVIGTNLGGGTDSEYNKRKIVKWLAKSRPNTPDLELGRKMSTDVSQCELTSFPISNQHKGKK
tara:strand:+ start:7354 stop:8106 length:753 start_codon:yes stop_codon:yes gene_type:complete